MTQGTDAHARRIQKGIEALEDRYGDRLVVMSTDGDIEMHAGNIIKNDWCLRNLQRILKHFDNPFEAVCEMLRTNGHQLASVTEKYGTLEQLLRS